MIGVQGMLGPGARAAVAGLHCPSAKAPNMLLLQGAHAGTGESMQHRLQNGDTHAVQFAALFAEWMRDWVEASGSPLPSLPHARPVDLTLLDLDRAPYVFFFIWG